MVKGRYNRGYPIEKKSYEQRLLSKRRQGTSDNSKAFIWLECRQWSKKSQEKKAEKLVRARFWESLEMRLRHFFRVVYIQCHKERFPLVSLLTLAGFLGTWTLTHCKGKQRLIRHTIQGCKSLVFGSQNMPSMSDNPNWKASVYCRVQRLCKWHIKGRQTWVT